MLGGEPSLRYISYGLNHSERDKGFAGWVEPLSMRRLELAIDLWLMTFRFPHIYSNYVLNGMFVGRMLQSIRERMLEYWSSYHTAPSQKLGYHCTMFSKMQVLKHPGEHAAVFMNSRHKSKNCQQNRCRETINHFASSRTTALQRS